MQLYNLQMRVLVLHFGVGMGISHGQVLTGLRGRAAEITEGNAAACEGSRT